MKLKITLAICILVGSYASAAQAASSDPRIRGAKLCTSHIPNYERQYGIPSHLLSAISSTESGRYHKGLKIMLPWPWTINVAGKGYYFNSKAEAIAAVRKHQAQGKKSIDIGCMQVNLKHHPNAFASLEKAFDPKYNVQYAASFLRRLYEEEKSWRKAASAYHSKTPSRGSKYVARVFRSWETIVKRLRLPSRQTMQRADASFDGKDMVESAQAKPVKLSRKSEATAPAHKPVKMKVIKVSDAKYNSQPDLIMIKPDVKQASAEKAYKTAVSQNITRVDQQPKEDMNIIRFNNASASEEVTIAANEKPVAPKTSSGPRFIFTD